MWSKIPAFSFLISCSLLAAPLLAHASDSDEGQNRPAVPLATNTYHNTALTTNASGGSVADPNLVNPWGLSRSSGGPWWVSDNGTGLSTLYTGTGSIIPLVVTVPAAKPGQTGSPTGTVYNGTQNFVVGTGPAFFLFATEDGTISGWNGGAAATIVVNESKEGASFKGLTMATAQLQDDSSQTLLYAADFTLGRVEVFNSSFHHVREIEEMFRDDDDDVSGALSPFNVQNLGGNIYVSYAALGSGNNQRNGEGLGAVKVFSPQGHLLMKLQRGAWMNAPWGMAVAPSDFGPYSHSILVGNFGSGWIAAFDSVTGRFQDFLRSDAGGLVTIPGLWAIAPGNDAKAGNATSLYYAAGGANESTGVLGTLTATQNPQGNDQ